MEFMIFLSEIPPNVDQFRELHGKFEYLGHLQLTANQFWPAMHRNYIDLA